MKDSQSNLGKCAIALLFTLVLCSTLVAQTRNSTWLGGSGNWFGPADTCVSWDTCSGPGTNPGESGFTDNVFINAPGSAVTLNGGVTINSLVLASGNSLNSGSTNYIDFIGSGSTTMTNNGQIMLSGAAAINSIGSPSPSTLTLTLAGTGSIDMSSASNRVAGSAGTIINQETIDGQGQIGLGGVQLVNQGTIDAFISGGTLTVQPSLAGMTNTGTLRSTSGGILDLEMGGTTLNNTGGLVFASGGSTVILGGGTYSGGTLQTAGTGVIETLGGGANPMLTNLTLNGTFDIQSAGSSTLQGTITNNGVIALQSNGGGTDLFINGNVTLAGGGAISMQDSAAPNNFISGAGAGSQLTNLNEIEGAGTIGDSLLTIVNQGLVRSTSLTNPLNIAAAGFTNQGTVLALAGTTLNIFSPFSNQGTLQAQAGSTVSFNGGNGALVNYNAATNTLTGGTYILEGTLQFTNSSVNIDTNAANITLDGAASQFVYNGTDALASLSLNSTGASLTVENGRNFTSAADFQNSGTLIVGNSSTFTTGPSATNNFIQNGPSSLTNIQSGGTLIASTYTLNAGTTQIDSGGKLTAANFIWNGGNLSVSGNLDPLSLTVCSSCSLTGGGTVTANVVSNGTIAPGTAAPPAPGTLTITGNFAQNSGGILTIDLAGTGMGQFSVLDVLGSATLDGTVDFTASGGFVPASGDVFPFLLFGSESGNFTSLIFSGCPSGDTCTDVFGNGELSLVISGSQGPPPPQTPEPGSLVLLGTGFIVGALSWKKWAVGRR